MQLKKAYYIVWHLFTLLKHTHDPIRHDSPNWFKHTHDLGRHSHKQMKPVYSLIMPLIESV